MKQIVFATGNKAKVARFYNKLLKNDIELVSIKDLNISLDVEENGKTAIENAIIKARECYEKTGLPSMGMDDTLYLEGVPEELQPGLFVRRVNGKTLNDEEMIEHYKKLVTKYGKDGKIDCKWIYGLCVFKEDGSYETYTWSRSDWYMTDIASDVINEDYPLNSISKYYATDKYLSETSEEERKQMKFDESDVIEFITNCVTSTKIR